MTEKSEMANKMASPAPKTTPDFWTSRQYTSDSTGNEIEKERKS